MTLLIARQVEPGYEETFEAWAHGILETAAAFPDHLGYGLFRPASEGGPWFLVHRFRNPAAFERWQESPERAQWFANCLGHHHTEIARRELHRHGDLVRQAGYDPARAAAVEDGDQLGPRHLPDLALRQRGARAVPGGSALRAADGRLRRRLQHA